MANQERIDVLNNRFPYCIVWTPIPLITWFLPFIGHMGIATSSGVIHDFSGSYYVSEDNMGFGNPTRYLQLDISKVVGGDSAWDRSIMEASKEYRNHVHNLFCDNCHSHVALALTHMSYQGRQEWGMVKLVWMILAYGKFVNFQGRIKTWLPFLIFLAVIIVLISFSLV